MSRTILRNAVRCSLAVGLLATVCVAAMAAGTQSAGTARGARVGLGKTLTTKDHGQIFGFDLNQSGEDGVLASAQTIDPQGDVLVSMETFDQDTGKITKSFAKYTGKRNEYSIDGIFAGDVALVTHYITPNNSIYAKRTYEEMNPVTAGKFTGAWKAPVKDIDVLQWAENQTTSTDLLFAIELKNADASDLIVTDVGTNSVSNVIHLDPNLFCLCNGPQLGQYVAGNQAVFALSPDSGAVGGEAPVNVLVDLASGNTTKFIGYNNGFYHAGSVNGLGMDPNTGIGATTTELNAQVEFYDMGKKSKIAAVQLPCTQDTDQTYSGSGIAVDPVNKLFLVTETYDACNGGTGSALVVYDESGNLVETIEGFQFFIGEAAPTLNPAKRMGWAYNGQFSQLRQFFY